MIDGTNGWVLAEDDSARSLGPALVWARRKGLAALHVLTEAEAGLLARRARLFRDPPTIWQINGRLLSLAEPARPPTEETPPEGVQDLIAMLREVDLEGVCEHGVLAGEVRGLEVARVVQEVDGRARLEVGVGRFDREAGALLHADVPTIEALRSAADLVRGHRRPGSSDHPISRLAPERWLRSLILEEPALVGAANLEPIATTLVRTNLKESHPAATMGTTLHGEPLIVVCSVGVDLDLVPTAADVRAARNPDARLSMVLPERDLHPVIAELVDALEEPAELIGVDDSWRD